MHTLAAVQRETFVRRLVGAALLKPAIYEEVEADRSATAQALVVVFLSSTCAGLGARGFDRGGVAAVAFFSMLALIAWAAWSLVTYEIGVRILPDVNTRADVGELLRTIGFATAPGILRIFGLLPQLTIPVFIITAVWMLAAMIVAVRQALDYTTTRRAVAVCALGWLFAIGFAVLFGLFFGPRVS
jgi:Yip1 domain